MGTLIWVFGFVALVALVVGVSNGEAALIGTAVILLVAIGILMSMEDRNHAPAETGEPGETQEPTQGG